MSKKSQNSTLCFCHFLPPSQMVHIGLALKKAGIHVIEFMLNCLDLPKVVGKKSNRFPKWCFFNGDFSMVESVNKNHQLQNNQKIVMFCNPSDDSQSTQVGALKKRGFVFTPPPDYLRVAFFCLVILQWKITSLQKTYRYTYSSIPETHVKFIKHALRYHFILDPFSKYRIRLHYK